MYFFGVSQTAPAGSVNEKSASICILRSGIVSSVSHSVYGSPEKLPCNISKFGSRLRSSKLLDCQREIVAVAAMIANPVSVGTD